MSVLRACVESLLIAPAAAGLQVEADAARAASLVPMLLLLIVSSGSACDS
jgi:hypothetical protein